MVYRRHFRELLTRSEERIASNILADRLTRLEKAGLVSRRDDPGHKQKIIYSLIDASIALVPLLAHMGGWGLRHTPASKELSVRAKILEDGGPKLWSEFMEELRHLHLEAPAPRGSVISRLQCKDVEQMDEAGQVSRIDQCRLHTLRVERDPRQYATVALFAREESS